MLLAILIFAAALALIATERADRTKVALAGAVAVLVTQKRLQVSIGPPHACVMPIPSSAGKVSSR